MKPRIYVDTSVIGGCLDPQFRDGSVALFALFDTGGATLVVSDLTLLELRKAPSQVQQVLERVPRQHREDVALTDEAMALARRYVEAGVVTPSKLVDAQHIAIATFHQLDVLVSWNFKHIVNVQRIRGYNSVNLRLGYRLLEIRTPLEVLDYGGH
jgi:hypothetical protein